MTSLSQPIAYQYRADLFCPSCIIGQLPTGDGEAFDGWQVAEGVQISVEENLSEIAAAFGFNRDEEWTWDSDDFPKVVFADEIRFYEVEDEDLGQFSDRCGSCHTLLSPLAGDERD